MDQLLTSMIELTSKHWSSMGRRFIDRGEYQLIHGHDRKIIDKSRWTYEVKAGITVEISILLRIKAEKERMCPHCQTIFLGEVKRRKWVIWKVYLRAP